MNHLDRAVPTAKDKVDDSISGIRDALRMLLASGGYSVVIHDLSFVLERLDHIAYEHESHLEATKEN